MEARFRQERNVRFTKSNGSTAKPQDPCIQLAFNRLVRAENALLFSRIAWPKIRTLWSVLSSLPSRTVPTSALSIRRQDDVAGELGLEALECGAALLLHCLVSARDQISARRNPLLDSRPETVGVILFVNPGGSCRAHSSARRSVFASFVVVPRPARCLLRTAAWLQTTILQHGFDARLRPTPGVIQLFELFGITSR